MAIKSLPFLVLLLMCVNGGLLSQPTAFAKLYYAAIVRKGPNWTPEQTPEIVRSGQEHRQYLENLVSRGILVLAGPFTDNGEIRGIYVFKVESQQQAKTLCDQAPAVRSGHLAVEVHPWQMANEIVVRR